MDEVESLCLVRGVSRVRGELWYDVCLYESMVMWSMFVAMYNYVGSALLVSYTEYVYMWEVHEVI